MEKIKRDRYEYNCTFIPLTPIQVGNGNELYTYDYVIKDGIYYRIEVSELFEKLPSNERNELIKMLENNNIIKIRKTIRNYYKPEYGYLYKCKVSDEVSRNYERKIDGIGNKNEENQLTVFEFIGNHRGKYIPGSSLKGAIRTAYLNEEFDKHSHGYKLERKDKGTAPFYLKDQFGKELKPKELKNEVDRREADILNLYRLEPKMDPFKYVQVTDTEVKNDLIKIEEMTRIPLNLKKQDMPMGRYEVTKSLFDKNDVSELNFKIIIKENQISKESLNELYKKESKKNMDILKDTKEIYIDEIFERLNKKAKIMIEAEKNFFEKVHHKMALKSYLELEKYLNNLKENEALIRFGRGAGFNSTTFNLVNKKVETVHTRVLIGNLPAGWAIITYEEN